MSLFPINITFQLQLAKALNLRQGGLRVDSTDIGHCSPTFMLFGPKYTGYVYIKYENTQNLTLPNVYLPVLKRVKWCFCVLLANSSLRLKRFFLKVN